MRVQSVPSQAEGRADGSSVERVETSVNGLRQRYRRTARPLGQRTAQQAVTRVLRTVVEGLPGNIHDRVALDQE